MENILLYDIDNSVYVNLTNACTNSCVFCIRDFKGVGYDLWLKHQPKAREVIKEFEKKDLDKYEEVVFCGYGEPTLRLDVMLEVADYIREKSNIKIRVNTNGLANLICKEDITPKLKGRFDTISISLNAKDAKQYNDLCKPIYGEKSFDAILEFTENCKKYVPEVILSVVDTYISAEDIEKCREIANNLGVQFRVRSFSG